MAPFPARPAHPPAQDECNSTYNITIMLYPKCIRSIYRTFIVTTTSVLSESMPELECQHIFQRWRPPHLVQEHTNVPSPRHLTRVAEREDRWNLTSNSASCLH